MRLRWTVVLFFAMIVTIASAQTARSTISGVVADAQGAVIANATVLLKNPATNTTVNGQSNGVGEFQFPELVPGTYSLIVSAPGFQTQQIDNIVLEVSKVLTEKVQLNIGASNQVVNVVASTVQVDTQSSALVAVIDSKSVADMPMNGRDFTKMTHFAAGASVLSNSVNGSRTASINFQLDGADNVDPWLGIVSSNQAGIAGIAGGLIPIEAIDQFSMQAGGEADQGRNAGANSNMAIKSGTNQIHGDVFYFDRNEFFAALSPIAVPNSHKPLIRNHQGGFTLGGPLWKDHTFLFLAGEFQIAKINTALQDTVLTNPWLADANALLADYGINNNSTSTVAPRANQLSMNLYNLLFPANTLGYSATTENWFANGTANYNSYNYLIKLDHHFSEKQALSIHALMTTGTQTAPTGSYYSQYFQTAPMHIFNFNIVHSYIFNSHLLNTVNAATNYFLQTFNDADQDYYPAKNAGLNLGPQGATIADGAPTIAVSGFDETGATQPSGRTDVTGHITDNLHWTVGRHELKFGGEYRHSNVDQLYFSNSRGSFSFDGSRGPWSGNSEADAENCANLPVPQIIEKIIIVNGIQTSVTACNNNILALADYLNGMPTNSSGARLLQGSAERVWTLDTKDAWAQDDFKVTKNLNLNFGVRYTVPGVIQAAKKDIYMFVPGETPGFKKGYYPEYWTGFAPRVAIAYSPFDNNRTVIHASYGLFYDFPAMSSWITGTSTNGGASYAQNNPAGPDAAATYVASNVQWQVGVNPFTTATPPQVGAFGVNQSFKMPRASVYTLNVEQQLTSKTLFTLGYVGSAGRHLEILYDLNQPIASGTSTSNPRPYAGYYTGGPNGAFVNENTQFSTRPLLGINQLNFGAGSNYNSMQVTLKQGEWKGLQGTIYYTWSRSMDNASSSTTPMNSYDPQADYGASTFDARHVISAFIYYNMPQIGHALPILTKGWQFNAIYSFSTGLPLTPQFSTNVDGTGELKDRPDYTGVSPYTGLQLASSTASGRTYRFLTNANGSFTLPNPSGVSGTVTGAYGNEKRDSFYGPDFKTVDFSLFKHFSFTERINSELRFELFNIFNFANFASPSVSNPTTSTTFGTITQTRNGASAPGIGNGEPFNIQLAYKITF